MKNSVLRYDPAIPMMLDIPDHIQSNPLYCEETRGADASLVKKVCRWLAKAAAAAPAMETAAVAHPTPATVPFTRMYLKAAFSRLTPAVVGREEKTIDNALSECNRIADTLGMPTGYSFVPLSGPCLALQAKLKAREDRGSCVRIFRFVSARQLDPGMMSDALVPDFKAEIDGDWRVEDKPREFRRALYAWNHAVKTVEGWPQTLLTLPIIRVIWGYRWDQFPSSLERQTDEVLGPSDAEVEAAERSEDHDDDLFDERVKDRLGDSGRKNQKEAVRILASALVHAGVPIERLVGLHDVVRPERYKLALKVLKKRSGEVNRTLMRRALDAKSIAKRSDLLALSEIEQLDAAYALMMPKHETYLEKASDEDRDQATLETLDVEETMDTYLALGHREMGKVRAPEGEPSVGDAYHVVRALTHEIGLTAPMRIGRFVALRTSQFAKVVIDGETRVMIRSPKKQARNKRTPDAFLSPAAAELLELYLRVYRPILLRHVKATTSEFLFPGAGGKMKHHHTMRQMMNRFVRKSGLHDFHPHLIRKITPKIILDEDPTAMPIAVRSGGWKDDRMIRRTYGQKNHRRTALKVNEFVQGRRLRAISTLKVGRRRKPTKPSGGAAE